MEIESNHKYAENRKNIKIDCLKDFYEKNKNYLNLDIPINEWHKIDNWGMAENGTLFSTNKKIKGQVVFTVSNIQYKKLAHSFLPTNISTPRLTETGGFSKFNHFYLEKPLEKYQLDKYVFPKCDNGKLLFDNISNLTNNIKQRYEEEERKIKELKSKKRKSKKVRKEKQILKLNDSQNQILKELDKDGG